MVGNLLKAQEDEIVTDFKIENTNLLNEEGNFSFEGLIENIAQTCAAGFGYLSLKKGEHVYGGYIGSISKLTAYKKPSAGHTIKTKVIVITQLEHVILVKGTCFLKEELLLECEMKIVTIQ